MTGNLSQQSFPDILRRINTLAQSGMLTLRRSGIEKRLLFEKGALIFASSTAPEDNFGELLLRIGQLSPVQMDLAIRATPSEKHLASTLVEMGLFEAGVIRQFLELQVQEIIYSIFEWSNGEYDFDRSNTSLDGNLRLDLPLPMLIFEGIRRIRNMEVVYRGLRGAETRIRLAPDCDTKAAHLDLTSEEAFVLSRVDACDKISEILLISPLGLELTQKTLYAFVAAGIVELLDPAGEKSHSASSASSASQASRGFRGDEPAPPASPVSAAPSNGKREELETLRRDILAMLENVQSKNFYDLLQVPSDASLDEIKKAYYALAKQYHPDRHHQFSDANVKSALETIFSTLAQAYDTLKTPAARSGYDAKAFRLDSPTSYGAGTASGAPSDASGTAQQKLAELNYRQGRGYFDQQDYWGAVQAFRQAVRLEPEVARYRYWLAVNLAKNPKWRREAEEHFMKAIELEQFNPSYYVGLGLLYREVGMLRRAESQFRQALQLSPDDKTAQEALDEMTAVKGREDKGLKSFSKLFRKK